MNILQVKMIHAVALGLHDEPTETEMSCIVFKNLLQLSENDANTEHRWLRGTRNKLVCTSWIKYATYACVKALKSDLE